MDVNGTNAGMMIESQDLVSASSWGNFMSRLYPSKEKLRINHGTVDSSKQSFAMSRCLRTHRLRIPSATLQLQSRLMEGGTCRGSCFIKSQRSAHSCSSSSISLY